MAVNAYETFAGHDGTNDPGQQGDGESCPGGRPCQRSVCEGPQSPSSRAHYRGGLGVLPGQQSVPMERLRGTGVPIGAGPPAGRTESLGQEVVAASGVPTGDGCPYA